MMSKDEQLPPKRPKTGYILMQIQYWRLRKMHRKTSLNYGLAFVFLVAGVINGGFGQTILAQSSSEKAVADVLRQNATAFSRNDMATLEKIWANDESVTVFEGGYANYGWADYRDNHLAPEMKEMKNTKYEYSEIKAKLAGKMAYATMKYTISGDLDGKQFDGAGLATAVLEKTGGNWRIVHWHSSATRRADAPTEAPAKKS